MFDQALKIVLDHEGGFVNHPEDPGGITNLGVTKKTWEDWTGKPATVSDMKALTVEQVAPLYYKNYWNKTNCSRLPAGLSLCVFDFAVNAGPGRAARYLQRLVGAEDDGVIGPKTLAAVDRFVKKHGIAEAIMQYQDKRRGYYRSRKNFPTFGKGWIDRVRSVQAKALEIAK